MKVVKLAEEAVIDGRLRAPGEIVQLPDGVDEPGAVLIARIDPAKVARDVKAKEEAIKEKREKPKDPKEAGSGDKAK